MKFSWLTDIHLNFLEQQDRFAFYDAILAMQSDAVLITGDIAEAPSVKILLTEMAAAIKQPIYFVLGNHDYYRGFVHEVHAAMTTLTQESEYLFWLPAAGIQQLTSDVVLVGQDGWADGRYGDYANTQVNLNDSRLIADLFQQNIRGKYCLLDKMQELANNDAVTLRCDLLSALKNNPKKIMVLTHVPPFKEICFNKGKAMLDNYLPYFASKATGDVLLEIAKGNPEVEFLVLCGHTHDRAYYQALNNLVVKVGEARYGEPRVEAVVGVF